MTYTARAKLEQIHAEAQENNDQDLTEILDTILLAVEERREAELADVCRVFEISLLEDVSRQDGGDV